MTEELKPVQLGIATAIVWGVCVFFFGILATYFNRGKSMQSVLGSIYPGYRRSLSGTVIGTIWALIDGFFGGLAVGWIYNSFTGHKCSGHRPMNRKR
jgi:hypothetical protein